MKVVLFCGGLGMRLRDYSDQIPKPLVEIGIRPILWHLMKYYAHFGHKDFVLCLGHGAAAIKNFFLKYDECVLNDFVLENGGKELTLLNRDINDWRITFVDTGLKSTVGERLRLVKPLLEGEEIFLANYADGLSDLDIPSYVENFRKRKQVACFLCVPAPHTFHIIHTDENLHVTQFEHVRRSSVRINGGFFALRREIFDYIHPGDELVIEPFARLIEKQQLMSVPYDGFWQSMDTFKDKLILDEMESRGPAPWQVWKR